MTTTSQQTRRALVATNGNWTSYNNTFSALTTSMFNNVLNLTISPVLPGMAGKTPTKGEKVYDHENKINFGLTPKVAMDLVRAIEYLNDNTSVNRVTVRTGLENRGNEFVFIRPNGVKLNGENYDQYVLRASKIEDGAATVTIYHAFEKSSFLTETADKTVSEMEYHSGITILKQILLAYVERDGASPEHGAKAALGTNTMGKTRPSYNAGVSEDSDGPSEETEGASRVAKSEVAKRFEDDDL